LIIGAGIFLFLHAPLPDTVENIQQGWKYDDITYINDQVGSENNLIAVYARKSSHGVQIRLDFLKIPQTQTIQIKISSGDMTKEQQNNPKRASLTYVWDYSLFYNHRNQVCQLSFLPANRTTQTECGYDKSLGSLLFEIKDSSLTFHPEKLIVFIQSDDSKDQKQITYPLIALFSSQAIARSNVLLAFWNSFPSDTPSLALRRWDGAHTGPFGQRHGLSQLIKNATAYKLPIFLLDLKQTNSLAALEYLNKLDIFKQTSTRDIISIPEFYPFDSEIYKRSGIPFLINGWKIPTSAMVYSTSASVDTINSQTLIFTPTDHDQVEIQQNNYTRVIKLPGLDGSHNNEMDRFGFSIQGKQKILSGLGQPDNKQIIFLGGSLPDTPLADSLASPGAMSYIKNHPWITPVDYYQLATLPGSEAIDSSLGKSENKTNCNNQSQAEVIDKNSAYNALICAPSNSLTTLAWNDYIYLSSETINSQEKALRSFYYADIDRLLLASSWLNQPSKLLRSISRKSTTYYLLSNNQNFLLFDQTGGKLILAISITPQGPLEWIAPTSQFAVGLSDPTTWSNGSEKRDPAVIQGAFIDNTWGSEKYNVNILPDGLEFSLPSKGVKKSFVLYQNELAINYNTSSPINTKIPLALSPYHFLQSGLHDKINQIRLQQKNNINLPFIKGNITLTSANWFYDSLEMMETSEDPNKEYPTGHYLPFPVGILDFKITSGTEQQIKIDIGAITP
jgi:hypothetical protein